MSLTIRQQKLPLSFGAIKVGRVALSNKGAPESAKVDIYRLTGSPDDERFLQQGLDLIQKEKESPTGHSMVPGLPGVNRDNHVELAKEGFELSKGLLAQFNARQLFKSPEVLVAVNAKTNELAGLELANIERPLKDGSRVYTPLKPHLATDKTTGDADQNHSSINWLFTLSPLRGIGLALSSVLKFPASVKRIDVVSETAENTPQAARLYKGLGFKEIPNMDNEKPIPRNPATPDSDLETFQEMHGVPMSVDRTVFDQTAQNVREKLQFEPNGSEAEVNLSEKVRFPYYPIQNI